jgi:hypothetical protein
MLVYPPPQQVPSENEDDEPNVTCYQWGKVVNNGKSRVEKIHKEGSPNSLYEMLVDVLPSFTTHHLKQQQAKRYQELKESLPSNLETGMLQIDFAENYTTQWQDEVQSAHWCKTQVAIMTAVHWHGNDIKSAVVVSDDTDHTKDSIVVFIDHLIKSLVSSDVKSLHLWSDGPSSQFKNRYMAAVIPVLESKYSFKLTWNFFAASHGKGPVDAVGGTVKRQVATRVNQHRAIVKDAESFYKCALESCKLVNVFYIPASKIAEELTNFQPIFNNAPALAGIFTIHELSYQNTHIQMKTFSYEKVEERSREKDNSLSSEIQPGTFVIVNYEFQVKTSQKEDSKTKRLVAIVKEVVGDL